MVGKGFIEWDNVRRGKPFYSEYFQPIILLNNNYDEGYLMYGEDADLCKRINQVSLLEYLPYTSVVYFFEKGLHKNFNLMKWHIQAMIKNFVKWGF